MTDFEDYEMQQEVEALDKLEQTMRLKQHRDLARWQQNILADETKKCVEQLGLNNDDFQKLMGTPEGMAAHEKDIRKSVQKNFQRKAQRLGKLRDPQGRFVKQEGQPKGRLDLSQVVEQRRDGKISSDAALGKMVDKTLHDFFLSTIYR